MRRAFLVACLLAVPALSAAQSAEEIPRTPRGRPALGGVWDYRTATPLERPPHLAGQEFFTDEEAAEFGPGANDRFRAFLQVANGSEAEAELWFDVGDRPADGNRTALIVDPPDGKIPARTEDGEERNRNFGPSSTRPDGPEDRGLSERCITFGLVPIRILPYNNNVHLFQTPGYVAILMEMNHEVRIIPLDGRPHLSTDLRQWLGDSRGRWEGDTLVIETTGFSTRTSVSGSGPAMRLTERFTRVDTETLRYEYTIDDPASFTRPWTVVLPMKRGEAPMFEYACHEGNYGLVNILSIARAEEEAARVPAD